MIMDTQLMSPSNFLKMCMCVCFIPLFFVFLVEKFLKTKRMLS